MPTTRLPLPGWRSHIGSGGKRSSEFWAQLRLTEACQPHQKPDTPAPCPRPLPTHPPACPAGQHSHPGCCTLRLPGPVPPAPSPTRPMPPWPSPLRGGGGPGPCTWPFPPSEGLFRRGEAAGGAGRGGASPSSFSERAQSWSQKSRRRDIQTEPRRVWQERGREGAGGGEKRGRKERRGEGKRGPQFPNPCSRSCGGTAPGCGTQGRPGSGGDGLRPTETAQHPRLARPGHSQAEAKINAHWADRGRPVGGPNTYPHLTTQRASVHDRPGARAGPTAGPPRLPDLMGSNGKAGLLPAAGPTATAGISHYGERRREAREGNSCGATHIDGHRDKAQDAQCHGGKTHRHSNDTYAIQIDTDRSTCMVKHTDTALL